LVKSSTSPNERRDFQQLEQRFASLATRSLYVLRCLGAAVVMQWDALPTSLRRVIFDTAGSLGKLMETVALRGQFARFLHKQKTQE